MATDRLSALRKRRHDHGFTLVEVLIVVVVMGALAATLSTAVTVALRALPGSEDRLEGARSVQGLVTWLPQDVDAAPPDGFDRDPATWPCAGAVPADSHNVLSMSWFEQAPSSSTYAASYRYELRNGEWRMVRYFCTNGAAAKSMNLTSELPAWDPADPPAQVVMCSVVIDAAAVFNGTCPAAHTHPAGVAAPAPVRSLKLIIEQDDGPDITIDAAPKNPDASLADDPDAASNKAPTVQNLAFTLSLAPNEVKTFDLASYFGTVDDPDGEEANLTVSVDPTEPLPSNLVSAATAYSAIQFELTLTAGPTSGTAPQPLMLIVSDERGGWKVVQVTIEVSDPPNVAPWLDSPDPNTRVVAFTADPHTTSVDIAQLFNVQDDQPVDQLLVSLTSVTTTPEIDVTKFTLTPSGGDLVVEFAPGFVPSVGGEIAAELLLTDAEGASLVVYLGIQVLHPSDANNAPTAATSNVAVTIESGQGSVVDVLAAHGVSDADVGDDLTATIVSSPAAITATSSDTVVDLQVPVGAPAGVMPPVVIRVSDLAGAYVDVTVTVTITDPPVPPSNCVLGTLVATPSTVARQGGGTAPRKLYQDVTVTLTYTGTCDGLRLNYDSGDSTGLGTGVGRVFPPGSPTSIVIVGHFTGGTEKFTPGVKVLTASTSSAITANSVTTTLTVS